MIRKAILAFLCTVCCNGFTFSQVQGTMMPWTLERCIEHALANNIQVRRSLLTNENNTVNIEQARGQRLPSLDLSVRQSQSWSNVDDQATSETNFSGTSSTNYNVNTTVTLFNGFIISNRIRQTELEFESGRFNSETIKESVSLNVLNGFLQVLYAGEQVKNIEKQVEASSQQLYLAEQRLSLKAISRSDYLQVKSQLASEKLSLANASNQLTIARVNLMQLLELEVTPGFEISRPDLASFLNLQLEPDAQVLFQQAVAVKPQIRNASLKAESALLEEKIARAGYIPLLSFSAGFGTGFVSIDPMPGYLDQLGYKVNPTVGLTLSAPILQKNQVRSGVSRARIGIQNAELDEIDVKNQLRKDIEQACVDVIGAQIEYEASLEQYQSTFESHELAAERFKQGMINSVDYLFEKTNLIVAESQSLQAKYSLIFSYKILDFYTGIPIAL